MKAAILNDSHFGKGNDAEEIIAQQRLFFEKIFFPYLIKNDIKEIFHLGDLLDNRKAISPKTLYFMRKILLEPIRENGIHMTIIPGNHDVFYKNTHTISGLKETLGYFTNNVTIIQNNPVTLSYANDAKIGWIPWVNKENEQSIGRFLREQTDADVILGHFEFGDFYMDQYTKSRHGTLNWADGSFDKFQLVLTGHFHHKSQKGNIHYLGSQYEMTWSDHNDPKYFHVLEKNASSKEYTLTSVRNPYTLFNEIDYRGDETSIPDPDEVSNKFIRVNCHDRTNQYEFDRFIEKLETFNPYKVQIRDYSILSIDESLLVTEGSPTEDDDISLLESISWKDTMGFATHFIDAKVDLDKSHLDKEILHQVFRDIYKEAESIDQQMI